MKSLRDTVRPVMTQAAGTGWRDGLLLLEQWPAIVGADLAVLCRPQQLRFPNKERRDGTLVLGAPGAARLELQHHAPVIMAKVNGFFGYAAVARLQLVAGDLPVAPLPVAAAKPLEYITLQQALAELKKAVQTG